MLNVKNILVPTDFSNYAHNALIQAADVAKKYQAKIYLLHVIDAYIQQCVVDYCLPTEVVNQLQRESAKQTKTKLEDEIQDVTSRVSGVEIVPASASGTPFEEIMKFQEENSIDLIVIAAHGKTGLLNNLMGSVSDKIVRSARCPVMVIRN